MTYYRKSPKIIGFFPAKSFTPPTFTLHLNQPFSPASPTCEVPGARINSGTSKLSDLFQKTPGPLSRSLEGKWGNGGIYTSTNYQPTNQGKKYKSNKWFLYIMNEGQSEWMDDSMNEWMSGWEHEWMSERRNGWMSDGVEGGRKEWKNKWTNEWKIKGEDESRNEWIKEGMLSDEQGTMSDQWWWWQWYNIVSQKRSFKEGIGCMYTSFRQFILTSRTPSKFGVPTSIDVAECQAHLDLTAIAKLTSRDGVMWLVKRPEH